MADLTDRAERIYSRVPAFYRPDRWVAALYTTVSAELDRLEDTLNAIRAEWFPSATNDDHKLLSIWEKMLGLPVAPTGVLVDDRRTNVQARLRGRNVAAATDWVDTITRALGTPGWSHSEGPGANQVTISIPAASGSYSAAQVADIALAVTPAHLQLFVNNGQAFLVGISQVGVDTVG